MVCDNVHGEQAVASCLIRYNMLPLQYWKNAKTDYGLIEEFM
jgi:hypothetical protein